MRKNFDYLTYTKVTDESGSKAERVVTSTISHTSAAYAELNAGIQDLPTRLLQTSDDEEFVNRGIVEIENSRAGEESIRAWFISKKAPKAPGEDRDSNYIHVMGIPQNGDRFQQSSALASIEAKGTLDEIRDETIRVVQASNPNNVFPIDRECHAHAIEYHEAISNSPFWAPEVSEQLFAEIFQGIIEVQQSSDKACVYVRASEAEVFATLKLIIRFIDYLDLGIPVSFMTNVTTNECLRIGKKVKANVIAGGESLSLDDIYETADPTRKQEAIFVDIDIANPVKPVIDGWVGLAAGHPLRVISLELALKILNRLTDSHLESPTVNSLDVNSHHEPASGNHIQVDVGGRLQSFIKLGSSFKNLAVLTGEPSFTTIHAVRKAVSEIDANVLSAFVREVDANREDHALTNNCLLNLLPIAGESESLAGLLDRYDLRFAGNVYKDLLSSPKLCKRIDEMERLILQGNDLTIQKVDEYVEVIHECWRNTSYGGQSFNRVIGEIVFCSIIRWSRKFDNISGAEPARKFAVEQNLYEFKEKICLAGYANLYERIDEIAEQSDPGGARFDRELWRARLLFLFASSDTASREVDDDLKSNCTSDDNRKSAETEKFFQCLVNLANPNKSKEVVLKLYDRIRLTEIICYGLKFGLIDLATASEKSQAFQDDIGTPSNEMSNHLNEFEPLHNNWETERQNQVLKQASLVLIKHIVAWTDESFLTKTFDCFMPDRQISCFGEEGECKKILESFIKYHNQMRKLEIFIRSEGIESNVISKHKVILGLKNIKAISSKRQAAKNRSK